jgi:hypothetical protein
MRRVSGHSLELYVNGVLVPWKFKQEPGDTPQTSKINFASLVLYIGRGAVESNRFWKGYLDCFKFFKDDAKTADWALAEYNNLMDVDGGVIFGSPETVTTASVWGETVKIQADQLSTVDFKADKYASTPSGTITLDSAKPFDNPANGTFTDRGANTVRYTNKTAVDPDNGGKVHLTNGVGNVIIPVRAHIITGPPPPPPSGYYSRPNIGAETGKTPRDVGNRAALVDTVLPKFANGTYSTATDYIRLTGDITGATINITTGGTHDHPLVIMSDDGGNPDSWPGSRPVIKARIITKASYIWFYGIQHDYDGTGEADGGITIQSTWVFITACRFAGVFNITILRGDATINNVYINYNAFMVRNNQGGERTVVRTLYKAGSPGKITGYDPAIFARNYFLNHPDNSDQGINRSQLFYIGPGIPDHVGYIDVRIEYNFADCIMRRGIYVKCGATIKWNDITVQRTADNLGADCVIGCRGETPEKCIIAYNRIDGGNQLMSHGFSHLILSNIVGGGCWMGAAAMQTGSGKKDTKSSDGARFIGNTGPILVPLWTVNSDDPAGKLGDFDPGVYSGLPAGKNVVMAGPNQTYHEDADGTYGTVVPVSSNHPQQTKVGSYDGYKWRNSSQIWIYNAIDAAWGYTLETPPVLNTTVCGPKAKGSGKLWGT